MNLHNGQHFNINQGCDLKWCNSIDNIKSQSAKGGIGFYKKISLLIHYAVRFHYKNEFPLFIALNVNIYKPFGVNFETFASITSEIHEYCFYF